MNEPNLSVESIILENRKAIIRTSAYYVIAIIIVQICCNVLLFLAGPLWLIHIIITMLFVSIFITLALIISIYYASKPLLIEVAKYQELAAKAAKEEG